MTAEDGDGAELDALAIAQTLARIDPGWSEPTGTGRGLVIRRADHAATCVVTTAGDWIYAMVIPSPARAMRAIAAVHQAIWGDGIAYAVLPAGSDGSVTLIGRADGQPAPVGGHG